MSTPVATIADALIAFIMSLLRDPAAVDEFAESPQTMMARSGVGDACLADVKAVKPVIVDNAHVTTRVVTQPVDPRGGGEPRETNEVIREISRIVNQFTTIDARSTVVDQSVNQNIWTNGGDVSQIFDQDSVVASGDGAVAAGDDATVVDSDVDVTIGDVSIGNTANDGSFNTTVTQDGDDDAAPADADAAAAADADEPQAEEDGDAAAAAVSDIVDDAMGVAGDAVQAAATTAVAATEPAEDPLGADLAAADTYETEDPGGVVVEDAYVEEPVEEP
ncbi:IniB N-terminal domain-containing protein [Microbacterium sp. Root61]|uniref:IniB N-terminal domain-containing protein n=1 Tax=Microbacterium sp. Root61 TaxID=1736570 RepID=UPI0009E7A148|nr:IniB N-terminal domain-containing protein [Microbacterium sp. Root61]